MASPVTPRHITDWILQIVVFMLMLTLVHYLDLSMAVRARENLYGFEPSSGRDGANLGYLLTQTFFVFVLQACCRTLTDREIRLKGEIHRLSPWRMAQAAALTAYFCVFLIWSFMAVPSGVHPGLVALVGFGCLSALVWPAVIRSMDPSAKDVALIMLERKTDAGRFDPVEADEDEPEAAQSEPKDGR
jgi:hypothetical protein